VVIFFAGLDIERKTCIKHHVLTFAQMFFENLVDENCIIRTASSLKKSLHLNIDQPFVWQNPGEQRNCLNTLITWSTFGSGCICCHFASDCQRCLT